MFKTPYMYFIVITTYYALKHWLTCDDSAWDAGDRIMAEETSMAWESLALSENTIDVLDTAWEHGETTGDYVAFEDTAQCVAMGYTREAA